MKLKTKFDKHANDDEKRRKALNEKAKVKSNQSEIIKQALSTATLHNGLSKKIVFDDDDDDIDGKTNGKSKSNPLLFDRFSDDDENQNFEIKEKAQFGGKKGFELLKLQSTYGNDERFKIDERFIDEDETSKNNVNDGEESNAIQNYFDEKTSQLKILDGVLGESSETSKSKKPKKRTFEMIRYDALNKDHEKYEIKQPKLNNENDEVKNKKIGKKSKKLVKERKPTIVVSKEKFYEVSTNIKDSFKESNNVGTGFSLLQAYGKSKEENEEEEEEEEKGEMIEEIEDSLGEAVDEHLDESANKVDLDQALSSTKTKLTNVINEKISKKPFNNCKETVAKGIWKETFFFTPDDPRLQEGLDFINKKNSDEACAAAEKYGETRKKLREIIRLHNRKQLMKKNPFKNKVGGMTKKQMINSKNRHKVFDKKRPPKVQQEFCLICHFLLSLLLKLIYRRLAPVNGNLSPECADVLLSFDALSISNAKALLFFNRLTNTA